MGKGAACRDLQCRFHTHIKHCGGAWVKVKEPEGFGQKAARKKRAGVLWASCSALLRCAVLVRLWPCGQQQ